MADERLSRLVDELAECRALLADYESRIKAVRNVIVYGYPGQPGKIDKCPHEKYGYEDCIICYDEALLNAVDGVSLQTQKDAGTEAPAPLSPV